VAPRNPSVPNGAAEADLICTLFNGTSLLPASISKLDAVLASNAFELVHFACHGQTSGARQELRLEGNERLAPHFLQALPGVRAGLERSKPLVFLNACEVGRQAPRLLDAGGFPVALVELAAGSVIAPLWSVKDQSAFEMAREFYEIAIGDPTLPAAEIVSRLRRRAYEDDPFDDTYAAYTFYGDPLATLEL